MNLRNLLIVGLCNFSLVAAVADQPNAVLLSETFDGSALPAGWSAPNSKAFSLVAGELRGICAKGDSHGPAVSVPITGHDLEIHFDLRMPEPGHFLFLVDGESQFGGQAHLLRLSLGEGQAQLAQDRGSMESKIAQAKERRGSKSKAKASEEQLADPKFYRTERLALKKYDLGTATTHVQLKISGNKVRAEIGPKLVLEGVSTVLDVPKSRIVFLVGQQGEIRIDNLNLTSLPRSKF